MDKNELIKELTQLIQTGELTKKELMEVHLQAMKDRKAILGESQSRLSVVLNFVGGIIVFLGIVIFIGQNWVHLDKMTKILATLGSAIAAYAVGILLRRYQNLDKVSQVFYFLSGLIAPIGLAVTFDIAGFQTYKPIIQSLMDSILLSAFLTSYVLLRRNIFLIFSIIFGTGLYLSINNFLFEASFTWRSWAYHIMAVNVTYLFLAYYYANQQKATTVSLGRWLYGIGAFGFLCSAMILGGWKPEQSIFWELSYPFWIFGTLFLSTLIKHRIVMLSGILFLIGYILKITSEYFAQGLGWPLALIFIGLATIGISYFAFYLNRKYIAQGS